MDRSVLLVSVLFFAAGRLANAQTFSIDGFTIDGGGGTSTCGTFSLVGGFWSLFVVQTPGAPFLTIRLTTTNTGIVSWPSPSTGFALQQNADLNTTNWTSAPEVVRNNGTDKFIIVSPPVGNRFYRLFKP